MLATEKTLHTLTAEDLMSCPVAAIPQRMPLGEATRLLARARVSGAPVVDEEGRCVGVFSATDVLRLTEKSGGNGKTALPTESDVCLDWQLVEAGFLPNEEVGRFMTRDVETISPAAGIAEMARRMLDTHIHRLIVVDSTYRPLGIVSSMDILSAVAHLDSVLEKT